MALAFLLVLAQISGDRFALSKGVDTLVAPGALPGGVMASGRATVILRTGDLPTLAVGPVGTGRAAVAGHGAFFSGANLDNPSNGHLYANMLAWLSRRPVSGLKIGLLDADYVAAASRKLGAETIPIDRNKLSEGLSKVDILLMGMGALDGDVPDQEAVIQWTKAGHGLFTAGPGWGWQQLNPNKKLRTDLAANRMLLPFGLGLSDELADGTPGTHGADDPLLVTEPALIALKHGGLAPADVARATGTVSRALSLSPLDDPKLVAEIGRLASAEGTNKWPITKQMPFSRLEAIVKLRAWQESPPEKVRADPSASLFPGPIPPDAKRVARTVEIDTKVPDWHSIGLYAPPGEPISITLNASAAGKGVGVRIGSHTDTLWGTDQWNRFPEISRRWPLDQSDTTVASPFGGTIFIDVPQNCMLGKISVTVDGAVLAPHYIRGKTTLSEWAAMLAKPGGPWAEMEAHGIILSVPRSAVEDLKDPEPLMAYWDEVADQCYSFFGTPRRPRAERYCVDRQISNGYMHNGYPIMTFEDVAKTFTDVAKLRGKDVPWGFYHELGHNFQEASWTFNGTGEVTNNMFSLYAAEHFNGQPHPGGMSLEEQRKRTVKYLNDGAKFVQWQDDPFLALVMYDQLHDAFGWAPFTKAFNAYREQKLQPKDELAQHDEWMIQMARAVSRNLGPFFVAWGVPTSDAARRSIANLPVWMPADWPHS